MHGIVHGGVIGATLGLTGGWLARSNSELALVHALKRKGGIKGVGTGKAKELEKLANLFLVVGHVVPGISTDEE